MYFIRQDFYLEYIGEVFWENVGRLSQFFLVFNAKVDDFKCKLGANMKTKVDDKKNALTKVEYESSSGVQKGQGWFYRDIIGSNRSFLRMISPGKAVV